MGCPPPLDLELIRRVMGARSASRGERIQSLWSGYGEILRVELTGAAAPSVIVKQVSPPELRKLSRDPKLARSHRRKLRSYEVEQAFYRSYAALCGSDCRVPTAYHLSQANGGWLFVLEDLDAAGYAGRSQSASPAEITEGLRWLASFHATFMAVPPKGLWPVGSYWHLGTRPDELAQLRDDDLRRAAPQIAARLEAARFKTFVHGDAKLENFCFAGAIGEAAALDFQYVGGGVGVKDVAYFLSSCLAEADCEAGLGAYLDSYFAELGAAVSARNARGLAALDIQALEAEWRALFPFAWVDFRRFLLGWAPGHYERDPFSDRLVRDVLRVVAGVSPQAR